jgi:pyrrolidone-carboxylate peptidase
MESIKILLQSFFRFFGYHISKRNIGVSYQDAFSEQRRLMGENDVNVIFDIGAADGRTSLHYYSLFPNALICKFK